MKIYDISQEVFTCSVYPGDRKPEKLEDCRMDRGDTYNLTSFQMCAHNGTHIDAPFHFFADGATVDTLLLSKMVGPCTVVSHQGTIRAEDAGKMLLSARETSPEAAKRLLIQGDALVTLEAAKVFAEAGLDLLGVESQSVGPMEAPKAVHEALLSKEVVLLEGLCLQKVAPGSYFLSAAPLSLAGADGAPCRAILIEDGGLK